MFTVLLPGPVEGEEGGAYGAGDLGLWRDGDFEAAELRRNEGFCSARCTMLDNPAPASQNPARN